MQMSSMYPTPKHMEAGKDEYMRQWQGLNASMVAKGVEKLRNRYPLKWLPDPVEFAREFCQPRPEDYGLPTLAAAWDEVQAHCHNVLRHRWSHDAVRAAGNLTGWSDIAGEVEESIRKKLKDRFERNYHAQMNRIMAGGKASDTQLLESDKDKGVAELNLKHHDQKQREEMERMGINPNGGRAEFLKKIREIVK